MIGPKKLPNCDNRFPRPTSRSSLFFTQNSPRQTWQVEFDSKLYLRPKDGRFFAQNKQISTKDLLSPVKTYPFDSAVKIPSSPNLQISEISLLAKKFLQPGNLQKSNNQDFAKINNGDLATNDMNH